MRLDILTDEQFNSLFEAYRNGYVKIVAARLQTYRLLCNTCPYDYLKISQEIEHEREKRNYDVPAGNNQVLQLPD